MFITGSMSTQYNYIQSGNLPKWSTNGPNYMISGALTTVPLVFPRNKVFSFVSRGYYPWFSIPDLLNKETSTLIHNDTITKVGADKFKLVIKFLTNYSYDNRINL